MNHSIEEWRDVVGYGGKYQVSNWGRVKSFAQLKPRIKVLRPFNGYRRLNLLQNRITKTYFVHTLVLEAFVCLRPEGCECNHKDGNRTNNHLDNLEWVTPRENIRHADATGLRNQGRPGVKNARAKLTDEQIRAIREDQTLNQYELAAIYGVTQPTIHSIRTGKTWRHLVKG